MVNGFVKEGVLHDESIGKIIPRQIELIKEYQKEGQLIIFIKDTHTRDSIEHRRFPDLHCVKGSGEEEIVDENGNKKKLYIVSKSSPYLTKLFNDIESWVNKD